MHGRASKLVLSAALIFSAPSYAAAQQSDAPPEVVLLQTFGSNGRLTLAQFTSYLAAKEFSTLDRNEDGVLDLDEYTLARLYLRSGNCQDLLGAAATFDADKKKAGGPLDAKGLVGGNESWKGHVEAMAAARWKQARKEPGEAMTLPDIKAYLMREAGGDVLPTAAEREKTLLKTAGDKIDPVPELTVRSFFRTEAFSRLDRDGSGNIDFREFTAAFPAFEQSAEFCEVAGQDFMISPSDFEHLSAEAPNFQRFLLALIPSSFVGDVSRAALRSHFKAEQTAAEAEARLRDVGPHGFVPGYGFLVHGKRTVQEKKITYDADQRSVFIRLLKDFTFDDPTTAEPATLAVTKEKGTHATMAIDATFQVDFDPASTFWRRLSVGIDAERNTATDPQVHRQRYYAAANVFVFHAGSPLESHAIRFAPYVENDDRTDVRRLAGDVIWTPGLHVRRLLTSTWMPIGRHADWYVTPRVVLEFGTVLSESRPSGGVEDAAKPDTSHVRLELLWGLMVGRLNASFKTIRRRGFEDALGRSHFEELSAWWDLDDAKRFSVKTTAAWGKSSPTDAENKSSVTTGIGIRF